MERSTKDRDPCQLETLPEGIDAEKTVGNECGEMDRDTLGAMRRTDMTCQQILLLESRIAWAEDHDGEGCPTAMLASEHDIAIWLGGQGADVQRTCPHCVNDRDLAETGRVAHNAPWNQEGTPFDRSNGGIYAAWVTVQETRLSNEQDTSAEDEANPETTCIVAAKFQAAADPDSLHICPMLKFPKWDGRWIEAVYDLPRIQNWWLSADAPRPKNPILTLIQTWQRTKNRTDLTGQRLRANSYRKDKRERVPTLVRNSEQRLVTIKMDAWQRLVTVLDKLLPILSYKLEPGRVMTGEEFKQLWNRNSHENSWIYSGATLVRPNGFGELPAILERALANYLERDMSTNSYRITGNFAAVIPGIFTFDLELETFAKGLLTAALLSGSKETVNLVQGWTQGTPVKYKKYLALTNIELEGQDEEFSVGERLTIRQLPYLHKELAQLGVPEIWIGRSDGEVRGPEHGLPDIWGATCIEQKITAGPVLVNGERVPFEPSTISGHPLAQTSTTKGLAAGLAGLSLACNTPVRVACEWDVIPRNVRSFSVWAEGDSARRSRCKVYRPIRTHSDTNAAYPLTKARLTEAAMLAETISREGVGPKTQVAFQRWCSSMEGNTANRAIDLRIAFEALYAADGGGEIGYRVRTRCATHLGQSYEDRTKIDSIIGKFYSTASKFVHANANDLTSADPSSKKHATKTAQAEENMRAAAALCRQGLIKTIKEQQGKDLDMMVLTYG